MSSNTHSPCAACKFLRRKCTQECVFAPYFPPDQPQKFANVHRVYGASNVAKILNELNTAHREDAVTSLAYEAEARLQDPVYGCVGFISILQNRLKQLQTELFNAKKDLSTYIGPQALMIPVFHGSHQPEMNGGAMSVPMLGVPTGQQQGGQLVIRDQQQQQQQMFEAQQQEMVRFNVNGMESGNGFNQMAGVGGGGGGSNGVVSSGSLGLGGFDNNTSFNNQMQAAAAAHHQQHSLDYQLQAQLMFQPQQQSQPKSEGEES